MYGYVVNIESHQPLKRLSISELNFDKIVENSLIRLSGEAIETQNGITLKLDPNQPYDHNSQPIVVTHGPLTDDNKHYYGNAITDNSVQTHDQYQQQPPNGVHNQSIYPNLSYGNQSYGNGGQNNGFHPNQNRDMTQTNGQYSNGFDQNRQNMSYNEQMNPFSDKFQDNFQNPGNSGLPEPNYQNYQIYQNYQNNQINQNNAILRPNKKAKVAPLEPINNGMINLMANNSKEFEVIWHQLSYTLHRLSLKVRSRRNILKNLNGFFQSNNVTAILGPSGAGKSTLLEIICGRRKTGVDGVVRLRGLRQIKVGFVPQDNHLMGLLTVQETFLFASKLINFEDINFDHKETADRLITRFGLEPITHTKVKRCSGGQQKRLSIALEVLSMPNLLILDEPTTGLDSPSCRHIMDIMRELVSDKNNPIAVLATIHQPSVKLFNSFDRTYVLSAMGECVYNGPPQQLVSTLSRVGLTCGPYTSPCDFIIEVAAGDYGSIPIKKLVIEAEGQDMDRLVTAGTIPLSSAHKNIKFPFFYHLKLLLLRSQVLIYRDPFLTVLRIGAAIFSAISLSIMFGREVGKVSGCTPRELELYATPVHILSKKFETDMDMIMQNVCLLFVGLMIGIISGMTPTLLNFPKEMHVFHKEYHNGWYSCISYYTAKVLSDVPMQIITPFVYVIITYWWSNQPLEFFRFANLNLIAILLSFLAQSIGECCSAIWMNNQNAAVFAGGLIPLPMILFGGFLVKIERMPVYLRPLSWLSFLRFSFEGLMISTYGFGRCEYTYQEFLKTIKNVTAIEKPLWAQALPLIMQYVDMQRGGEEHELTDQETVDRLLKVFSGSLTKGKEVDFNQSLTLTFFNLEDYMIYSSIIILTGYMIALKVTTYYVLLAKLHSAK